MCSAGFLLIEGPEVRRVGGYMSGPSALRALEAPTTSLQMLRYIPTAYRECRVDTIEMPDQAAAKAEVVWYLDGRFPT